jgi:hypothetical protein
MHYLLHKVAKVKLDDRGVLRFTYEDGSGEALPQGPFYSGLVDGEVPLAVEELAKSGLDSPDEVQYLIAYHCGAFPNGLPLCLLQSLVASPTKYA